MANHKKKKNQKKVSVNITVVIVAAAVVAAIVLLLVGALIAQKGKSGEADTASGPALGEALGAEDGEVADYAEAGYITMGNYRGVSTEVTATEDEVLSEMQNEAEEKKTQKALKDSQVIKKGDYVFLDYAGYINGQSSEDLQAEDVALKIGDYKYVEDFENGLIGKKIGATYTIPVSFNTDYDDAEVAGKTVDFSIKVLGKFDNSYAKWLSKDKYKTVDAYKEYLKEKLKKENIENINELAWTEFMDSCKVKKYPEELVKDTEDDLKMQYENFAKASETTYEDLLASIGMDDDLVHETAQDTVRDRMIAKTIAKQENLQMDDESYRKYLMQTMEYTEKDKMTLKALVSEYTRDYGGHPKDDMLVELAKEFVGEHAAAK